MLINHTPITFVIVLLLDCSVSLARPLPNAELDSSREAFQVAVTHARQSLQNDLAAKLDRARKKGDLESVEHISQEKLDFQKKGILPTSVTTTSFMRTVNTELARLERAYQQAIKSHVRKDEIDKAKTLRDQLAALKRNPLVHPVLPLATIEVVEPTKTPKPLVAGAQAYTNRGYVWRDIPDELPVKKFFPMAGHRRTTLQFKVTKPGFVYIAISSEQKDKVTRFLTKNNWAPTSFSFKYTQKSNPAEVYVFRHEAATGVYELPGLNFSGPLLLAP